MTRHPIFARFYTMLSRAVEPHGIAEHRDEMLGGIADVVVEVGAGNGMNFARYPATVRRVIAVEPEPYLRARAAEAAGRAPVPVRVVAGDASALPLADGSADAAVASLVLCSVPDQTAALVELRRVLRPNGVLHFYEHVLSERDRHARRQRMLDRIWPVFGGGCHLTRDTPAAIEAAGFLIEQVRRFDFRPNILADPVAPHVIGRARNPGPPTP